MRTSAPAALALALWVAGCAGSPFVRTGLYDLDRPLPVLGGGGTEEPPKLRSFVVLLPDENGIVGEVEITTRRGTRVLRTARERFDFEAADEVSVMTAGELEATYPPRLQALPPAAATTLLYFENDSVELTEESRALLGEIVAAIAGRQAPDIRVVGHTDSTGSRARNLELSARRAAAVGRLLLAAGVEAASLELEPRGETELAVPTADEVREPRNRRVEVTVW